VHSKDVWEMFTSLWEFENTDACKNLKAKLIEEKNVSEDAYEEAKRNHFGDTYKDGMNACINLWGLCKLRKRNMYQEDGQLGYIYDGLQDDDEDEQELDEEDAEKDFEIIEKILDNDYTISENLSEEDMERVAYSTILQQVYNHRWYRTDNKDTYFMLLNYHVQPIKAGS